MTFIALQTEAHAQNMLLLFAEVTQPSAQLFVMNPLFDDVEGFIKR